jgi:outer membrane protein assembly factor BamB
LHEAAELARGGKFDLALDAYLQLRDDGPDELITIGDAPVAVPIRRAVDERIAAEPELRTRYRRRFEDRAAKLLADGVAGRKAALLRQLVEEFGPCESAARAWDALGDLAFERGDFAAARRAWTAAAHQDSGAAILRAKVLLAALFLREATVKEVAEFGEKFPKATGHLAGRDGLLSDALRSVAASLEGDALRQVETTAATTFAGDASRRGWSSNAFAPAAPRLLSAAWPWPDPSAKSPAGPVQKRLISSRQLTGHPLIWRGHVVISDGRRVGAYNLVRNQPADSFDLAAKGFLDDGPTPDGPHTLTVDGERLFARLGGGAGHLVALTPAATADGALRWKLDWHLAAGALPAGDGTAAFEGCPVVRDGRLFASWIRATPNRVTLSAGAWDVNHLADGPRWSRAVAEWPATPEAKHRPRLLTLAGPNVICGTDAGLIVAIDADRGVPRWAARYASHGPRPLTQQLQPSPRDVCPGVAADGRVFVAPADGADVMCFDQWTGASLWPDPPTLDVVHLLGVASGRLIVTADGALRGIGAIDVVSGRVESSWGDLSSVPPFGRGLILRDRVLFPTRDGGVKILGLDGRSVFPPASLMTLAGSDVSAE